MLNYKGLKATFEHLTVSDAQIDSQIERLWEQNTKTLNITDRLSQTDDEVVIDFVGICEGKIFEGGSAQNQPVVIGSGTYIPGFEEQLVGRKIGEEFDVNVTFPIGYPAAELAGRPAIFKCTLHEIHVRQKYAMDDEFAREVGGCESLAALRTAVRERMQSYVDKQAETDLNNHLMDQILETYECEISEEQLNKALDQEMQALEMQLGSQKLTLDQYLQFMNTTREALREDMIPEARRNVIQQNIFAEIAKLEAIEVDEQSVMDAFATFCQENNMTVEQLQLYFDERVEAYLTRQIIEEKVFDIIRQNAEITTVEK